MPAAVDGGDVEGVGEAVEGQRAGERDDDAAVDQPPLELALRLLVLVEVHLGGVLVEPGGDLVLGLLQRHGVDVVDLLADARSRPSDAARRRARSRSRPASSFGTAAPSVGRIDALGELRHHRRRAPGVAVSRLRTITQRTYSSTVSPRWLRPVVRT